jgi:hypothetical protein
VARALAWLLLAVGLAGLVVGSLAGAQLRRGLDFGVPLASPSGLAVDQDGRVYAGTAADRIHVYGSDGRFLRGWYLDRDAGRTRLRVVEPERIEVATEGSGRLHVFDRDGRLLASTSDPAAFARFGAAHDRAAEGPGGARYELDEEGALLRVAPAPRTVLAPPVRAPLAWFARAPLPALTGILAGSTATLLAGIVLAARARRASPPRTR